MHVRMSFEHRQRRSRFSCKDGLASVMPTSLDFERTVLSHHPFSRRRVRVLLPTVMLLVVGGCLASIPPRIRPVEVIVLLIVAYLAISAVVSICEFSVSESGLIVNRPLFPERFIPWDAIERVLIFSHHDRDGGHRLEVVSIGLYGGLSPLNRLPGLAYGQGFRETLVILSDSIEGYDALLEAIESHCVVIKTRGG